MHNARVADLQAVDVQHGRKEVRADSGDGWRANTAQKGLWSSSNLQLLLTPPLYDPEDDLADGWDADFDEMLNLSLAGKLVSPKVCLGQQLRRQTRRKWWGSRREGAALCRSRPVRVDYDATTLLDGVTTTKQRSLRRLVLKLGTASQPYAPDRKVVNAPPPTKIPLYVSVQRRGLQTIVSLRGAYCVRSSLPAALSIRWRLVSRHAALRTAVAAQFAAAAAAEAVVEAKGKAQAAAQAKEQTESRER